MWFFVVVVVVVVFYPFLPFFTASTLFNICKLVLYSLGEGHKFTNS